MKNISILLLFFLIVGCGNNNKRIYSSIKSPHTDNFIEISKSIDSLDLIGLNSDTLRILRNEIFARKGYIFSSDDLKEYFSKFDWYSPTVTEDQIKNLLTNIDVHNINLIRSLEENVKCICCDLFDFIDESSFIKFSSDEFVVEFNSNLNPSSLKMVDHDFYNKYLSDPDMFQDWGNDLNESYEIKHKYFGLINSKEVCKILIYEKFRFDTTEEKIFLLVISPDGKLIGKYLISEYYNYAGGRQRIRTQFSENSMRIFNVNTGIIDGIQDQDGRKYQYHYDSITTEYNFRKNRYVFNKSDTVKTTYWTK